MGDRGWLASVTKAGNGYFIQSSNRGAHLCITLEDVFSELLLVFESRGEGNTAGGYGRVIVKRKEKPAEPDWHTPTLDERYALSSGAAHWTATQDIPCGAYVQIREVAPGQFHVRRAAP